MPRLQLRRLLGTPSARAVLEPRGSILVGSLTLILVMSLLGMALFDLALLEDRLAIGTERDRQVLYVAESGLSRAVLEATDADGALDYSVLSATPGTTTLFTNAPFSGGSYTVTSQPLAGSGIKLTATACIPAPQGSGACPSGNVSAVVRTDLLKTNLLLPVFGGTSVTFSGNGGTDSFDSRNGPYNPATAGNNGHIYGNGTINVTGVVRGDILGTTDDPSSQKDVEIKSGTTVYGSVRSGGTVVNQGTVTGSITQQSSSTQIQMPPVAACGPPYSSGAGLSGTYSYNAATGVLTVSGGNTITLANGTYCFKDVTLSGGSILRVNGPVVIYLTGEGVFSGGGFSNTTLKSENLQVLSSYSGGKTISITGGGNAYMVLYAPQADVVLSGGNDFFGAVVAKSLTATGGSKVHFDEALNFASTLMGGMTSYKVESWQQCRNPSCS